MKKKFLLGSIVLTCALGLALTGCQSQTDGNLVENKVTDEIVIDDNRGNEVAGLDWRTTGSYVFGTLHLAEDVDVAIGNDAYKMTIFYNNNDRDLFAEVDFPYETTSEQKTAESITFEDIDRDGCTDISLDLFDQQGESTRAVYYWIADDGKFFCVVSESEVPEVSNEFSLTNFIGSWVNGDGMVIVVDSNYRWASIVNGEITCIGSLHPVNGVAELYTSEGTNYCTFTYNPTDRCVVDEFDNVYNYDGPVEEYLPDGFVPETID